MHFSNRLLSVFVGCCASFASVACSTDDVTRSSNRTREKYLGLEQPEKGFQVRNLGTTIRPHEDVEYCEVAELPGNPSQKYYVKSIEFGNAPFSHHLIITAAVPGSSSDEKLRAMNIGDRVPCLSGQLAFGEAGQESVGGIQQRYGRLDFPEGVGREYYGGQRVVFDYHYLNTSDADVEARSAFNFHLADADSVQHIARGFGFYNWTIDTPAHQTGSFTAECQFNHDVKVGGLTRHTHRWGTDYSVWFAGGARNGEHIWTSTDWEHDVDFPFSEPVLLRAGEGFRFQCNYNNSENHALRFGTNATDEMCILFGLIWDGGGAKVTKSGSCDISWIDESGIGHSATEGFPKPTEEEAAACLLGSGSPTDACGQCRCTSCATPLIKCIVDEDCKAIVDCFREDQNTNGCQSVIDEHSSAVGLLTQMSECLESECSDACSADD